MSQLRLAAVQHDITWNDRDANFERLVPRIAGAVACGAQLVLLTETFSTGEQYGFAVSQDNEGLAEAVNQQLEALREDGTYDAIFEEYFPGAEPS